jgi:hypothetical protein
MRRIGDSAIPPLSLTRALVDRLPARTDERGPILVEAPAPDFHERTAADILEGCDPPGTVWVFAAGSLIWQASSCRRATESKSLCHLSALARSLAWIKAARPKSLSMKVIVVGGGAGGARGFLGASSVKGSRLNGVGRQRDKQSISSFTESVARSRLASLCRCAWASIATFSAVARAFWMSCFATAPS